MLTPKENLMRTIYWENAEYVPLSWKCIRYVGALAVNLEMPQFESGYSVFGTKFNVDVQGPTRDTLEPPLFDDIADWREKFVLPDIDSLNIEALAEKELAMLPPIDRDQMAVSMIDAGNCFQRLLDCMGHELALISLLEDPESCMDFFDAYTTWKIEFINRCIDAYGLDIYVAGDDVASMKNTFISPETYRELIKPFHKRIGDAINARGVVYDVHCCGRTRELIGDYVDNGARMWQSAEPTNDLAGLLDKYAGKITVDGGWETTGEPSFITDDTDPELIRSETRRCLAMYKKPGYILWPTLLCDKGNVRKVGHPIMDVLIDEWQKWCYFDGDDVPEGSYRTIEIPVYE